MQRTNIETQSKRMIWCLITQRPQPSFEGLDTWYNEHLIGKRLRIRYTGLGSETGKFQDINKFDT